MVTTHKLITAICTILIRTFGDVSGPFNVEVALEINVCSTFIILNHSWLSMILCQVLLQGVISERHEFSWKWEAVKRDYVICSVCRQYTWHLWHSRRDLLHPETSWGDGLWLKKRFIHVCKSQITSPLMDRYITSTTHSILGAKVLTRTRVRTHRSSRRAPISPHIHSLREGSISALLELDIWILVN